MYYAFFLSCGYRLMRQSTVSLQNLTHFLREDGLGDFVNVFLHNISRKLNCCVRSLRARFRIHALRQFTEA